jgi:hypothetical protein
MIINKDKLLFEVESNITLVIENFKLLAREYNSYMADQSIWDCNIPETERKKIVISFSKRFSQLLRNFLFSFDCAYEHGKKFKNKVPIKNFAEDFDAQIEKYPTQEVHFIDELRNFAKYQEPPIVVGMPMSTLFTPEGLKAGEPCGISKGQPCLKTEDLLARSKWSMSMNFLKSRNLIPIIPVVSKALNDLIGFYSWLDQKIRSI